MTAGACMFFAGRALTWWRRMMRRRREAGATTISEQWLPYNTECSLATSNTRVPSGLLTATAGRPAHSPPAPSPPSPTPPCATAAAAATATSGTATTTDTSPGPSASAPTSAASGSNPCGTSNTTGPVSPATASGTLEKVVEVGRFLKSHQRVCTSQCWSSSCPNGARHSHSRQAAAASSGS